MSKPNTVATSLREKAEAAFNAGTKSNKPRAISVRPASFKGKDDAIVIGVRVGSHFMVPEHIDAICEALGLPESDELDAAKLALYN